MVWFAAPWGHRCHRRGLDRPARALIAGGRPAPVMPVNHPAQAHRSAWAHGASCHCTEIDRAVGLALNTRVAGQLGQLTPSAAVLGSPLRAKAASVCIMAADSS